MQATKIAGGGLGFIHWRGGSSRKRKFYKTFFLFDSPPAACFFHMFSPCLYDPLLVAQMVKNLHAMQETQVRSLS